MSERVKISDKKPEAKSQNLAPQIRRRANSSQSMNSPVDRILFLQRTIGNQAVARLIESGALQAKLRIGQLEDKYEQEADRVAEQVMRMPSISRQTEDARIQRKCPKCEEELRKQPEKKEEELQAKDAPGDTPEVTSHIEADISSMRGGGQPLPESMRAFYEPRFGHDFSHVRVHTDAKAAESARMVNALAYTVGRDIVFGVGQYVPETLEGKKLLAHELIHVVQQSGAMQRQAATSGQRPPFDDLPAELRNVLGASFAERKFGCPGSTDATDCFNRLDAGARIILTSLYNRLSRFGLWSHVLYVGGIWTSGVGGAHFTVKNHLSFFSSLLASGRFCVDTAIGGMLHRGATSVREISTDDSLHLSLGSGNVVSAHIDAISPASGRQKGGMCSYEPVSTAAHIGREVVPLAIPGLQIFPEPRPMFGLPEREAPPPEFIRLEFRFRGL